MANSELQYTALYAVHEAAGATMVDFAGYSMPVQYTSITREHLHARSQASLFDVSHMGQISVKANTLEESIAFVERFVPSDLHRLGMNRQRYTALLNDDGGIVDDIIVAKASGQLDLVVNAGNKQQVLDLLQSSARELDVQIVAKFERPLLAIQGPQAAAVLVRDIADIGDMKYQDVRDAQLYGRPIRIARSGYTGEDGFEFSCELSDAEALVGKLLSEPEVEWAGLGARDTLRLEAGLCLYGNELNVETTPIEANIGWIVSPARKQGDRANFAGSQVVLEQIRNPESLASMRVGLQVVGRIPLRPNTALYSADGQQEIGSVTSGTKSISLEACIAMAYLPSAYSQVGTKVIAKVRGKEIQAEVVAMPFVPTNYAR